MAPSRFSSLALGLFIWIAAACSQAPVYAGPPPGYVPVPMHLVDGYWMVADLDGDGVYSEQDGDIKDAIPLYMDAYVGDYYGDTYTDGYYSYQASHYDPWWSPWWDPYWHGGGYSAYGHYAWGGHWPWWYWYLHCYDDHHHHDDDGGSAGSGAGGGGGGNDDDPGDGGSNPGPYFVDAIPIDGTLNEYGRDLDDDQGGREGAPIVVVIDGQTSGTRVGTPGGGATGGNAGGSHGSNSSGSNGNTGSIPGGGLGGRAYNAYRPTASQRIAQPGGSFGRPSASERARTPQPSRLGNDVTGYGLNGTAQKHAAPSRPSDKNRSRWDSTTNGGGSIEPKPKTTNRGSSNRSTAPRRSSASSRLPAKPERTRRPSEGPSKSSARPSQSRPKSSARPSQSRPKSSARPSQSRPKSSARPSQSRPKSSARPSQSSSRPKTSSRPSQSKSKRPSSRPR